MTRRLVVVLMVLIASVGCQSEGTPGKQSKARPGVLRVLAGSELADLKPILEQARRDIGVTVEFEQTGTIDGARAVRVDLPAGFEAYLNLPGWFASGRGAGTRRSAADELVTQLDLIGEHVKDVAERLYESDAQRLRDQTRYLQDRSKKGA